MRTKVLSILLLIMAFGVEAAYALSPTDVLGKASAKVSSAKSVNARFTGTTSGTLVSSGNKFAINAGGFAIWYNGKDMWTYTQKTKETSVTTPTQAEVLESNPLAIVKGATGRFNATKVSEGGGKYTLKLTPKAKGTNVKQATVTINTSTWLPTSIDIVFTSNSRLTINITSITLGNAVAASVFEYPKAKYPGVEIIDLR